MNVIEHEISCSKCGKKIGLLSEVINGTYHTMNQSLICINCLPESLNEAEKRGYKPEVIKRVRNWLKE